LLLGIGRSLLLVCVSWSRAAGWQGEHGIRRPRDIQHRCHKAANIKPIGGTFPAVSDAAKRAENLSHSIATSSTAKSASTLAQATRTDLSLVILAQADLRGVPSIQSKSEQDAAASSLAHHSATLKEYTGYLGGLKGAVSAANSADALELARGAFVPAAVQMVVHPLDLSPEKEPTPTGVASQIPIAAPYLSLDEGLIPFLVGGAATFDDPAVGALLANRGGHLSTVCSATLIAPRVVLTAAHCIAAFPEVIFFQHQASTS
jgi:hypothetical protein